MIFIEYTKTFVLMYNPYLIDRSLLLEECDREGGGERKKAEQLIIMGTRSIDTRVDQKKEVKKGSIVLFTYKPFTL